VAAALAASLAEGYGGLVLAALLAGLGNAPFHPADFTILNRRVSPARIGHAYSVHGITGNLGWAAAPLFILGVSEVAGSWRVACGGMALVAAAVMLVLLAQREAIDDRMLRGRLRPALQPERRPRPSPPAHRSTPWPS
jgi:MFS family permease